MVLLAVFGVSWPEIVPGLGSGSEWAPQISNCWPGSTKMLQIQRAFQKAALEVEAAEMENFQRSVFGDVLQAQTGINPVGMEL